MTSKNVLLFFSHCYTKSCGLHTDFNYVIWQWLYYIIWRNSNMNVTLYIALIELTEEKGIYTKNSFDRVQKNY